MSCIKLMIIIKRLFSKYFRLMNSTAPSKLIRKAYHAGSWYTDDPDELNT